MRPAAPTALMALCAALVLTGCGGNGAADGAATAPQANTIAGKVTMADGSPLRGEINGITVSIHGVSEAAERVSYTPPVLPDGRYTQKVAGGQYAFNVGTITLLYQGNEFQFPLEATGNLWQKNRDAAEGIVQDFVWKPTGITPYGRSNGADIGNHTHWYGMSIAVRPAGYREDIKSTPAVIPDGTKLLFTLTPTGPAIDGTQPHSVTIERVHDSTSRKSINLNDNLPAPYDLTGVARLPDGSSKPLLLQGPGNYPNYYPSVQIKVEKDQIIGGIYNPQVTFVVD